MSLAFNVFLTFCLYKSNEVYLKSNVMNDQQYQGAIAAVQHDIGVQGKGGTQFQEMMGAGSPEYQQNLLSVLERSFNESLDKDAHKDASLVFRKAQVLIRESFVSEPSETHFQEWAQLLGRMHQTYQDLPDMAASGNPSQKKVKLGELYTESVESYNDVRERRFAKMVEDAHYDMGVQGKTGARIREFLGEGKPGYQENLIAALEESFSRSLNKGTHEGAAVVFSRVNELAKRDLDKDHLKQWGEAIGRMKSTVASLPDRAASGEVSKKKEFAKGLYEQTRRAFYEVSDQKAMTISSAKDGGEVEDKVEAKGHSAEASSVSSRRSSVSSSGGGEVADSDSIQKANILKKIQKSGQALPWLSDAFEAKKVGGPSSTPRSSDKGSNRTK